VTAPCTATSLRKDGSTAPLEISAILLRDGQGKPESILGVVADVSERRRAEEVERRTQRLESLGLLAGGIAHDFNNLLTGVFGFIELAQQSARDPELEALLRCASEPLARARSLTQQLLTFAKGGQPARRVAPIAGVIRSAVRFALAGTPYHLPLPGLALQAHRVRRAISRLAVVRSSVRTEPV
jgi:signal transduction histidine kinase